MVEESLTGGPQDQLRFCQMKFIKKGENSM